MKKEIRQDEFLLRRRARQKRLRRRRLIVSLVALLLLSAAVGVLLCFTVFFPIESISAAGSERYTADELLSSCGLKTGDNLLAFSDQSVAKRLKSALPYIETVRIRRSLPGKVQITVTDAEEYACYAADGVYYTVSKNGTVLKIGEEPAENLFEIRCGGVTAELAGPIAFQKEKTGKVIAELTAVLEAQEIPIVYIDVTDSIRLKAKVAGGFLVEFGSGNFLAEKTAHLAGMLKNIEQGKVGRIDLGMWTSSNPQGTFVEERAES